MKIKNLVRKNIEDVNLTLTKIYDHPPLVVDDILDEGTTLESIVEYCKKQEAAEVFTAVLIEKLHDHKLSNIVADFVGLKVDDCYIYGYGMDYKGYLRNAPGIFAINEG